MKICSTVVVALLCLSAPLLQTGCSGASNTSSTGSTPTSPASPAAPTISAVAPATIVAGASATTLTITGTGFTSSTAIQVGGSVETTTFVSATQVTATIPASQLIQGGMLSVIALNSSATSGAGTPINFEVDNPSPTIANLVPAVFTAGASASTLSVSGTGFVPTTVIQIAGASRSTAYVSPTQVNVILTAADLLTAGNVSLTAVNPTPGGGTSAAASIAINVPQNPIPGAITLFPSTLPTGVTAATKVTVTGTNFIPTSVVNVGGTARATTYVSATSLTFQLTVADQATAQRLSVTVVNPAPGGGTSPSASLILAAPTLTPVISAVQPTQFIAGSPTSSIDVVGTNLSPTSIVQWNGTALATIYIINSYQGAYVEGTVPASLLTATGTASITVSNPTAAVPLSNALPVTIVNPPAPTLTQITPASGPINTDTPVTLFGTSFTTGSTVSFNGTNLPATFVSSSSLTVILPAASISLPGNGSFIVTTPSPGGGTTAALPFTAYIGIVNNSMVYNPVNGLFYVSVPGSAGKPYGNSIVSVDPLTGALGTPIYVGSEPNKLALTSDGKFLWVGLDGASAFRKVDLTANTAGAQYSFTNVLGIYQNPPTALELIAVPGQTDSVAIEYGYNYGSYLAIFDSGVPRGTPLTPNSYFGANALQIDGTRSEIYTGSSSYQVYTYDSSGLTLKTTASNGNYASNTSDEMQIAGGILYTDYGQAFDPESGALLGSFYSSGNVVATGPTVADPTLGKVFILDNPAQYGYGSLVQIQSFNISDYNRSTGTAVPVNLSSNNSTPYPSRLARWGTNGLAFRTSYGVYSLRSNLVKDLSATSADLGIAITSSGTATGANTTYTATVTNTGPAAATNVGFTAFLPATGSLVSVTPSAGTCSTSNGVSCDLGGLASGATATVSLVVQQTTAGSTTLTALVDGSENDPNQANNQATSTVTVTGSAFNLTPVVASISPAAILAGSSDTIVTVTGSNFTSGSAVMLGGSALVTTFTSATTLTATVPSAQLATLGWSLLTVSTPAPGGGASAPLPLTVYSVITLGINHVLYDPYSRKIMASVGAGSTNVAGNSLVAITPETATVGSPVNIGSQPTNLALTSDGQILYTILSGSQSVARFNMLTQAADYTYAVPSNSSFDGGIALRGIATQPGTENTVALDLASFSGNAIYDFDPANKTAAIRGQVSGPYSGSCIQFLDAADLLAFDTDTSGTTLDHYTVNTAGFTYSNNQLYTQSTLSHFSCFKLSGGLAFANSGGVADPSTSPARQLGFYNFPSGYSTFSATQNVAPDTSLQRTLFPVNSTAGYSSSIDSIESFDQNTYLPASITPLPFATTEGTSTSYSVSDVIRWGQDGLAILTTGGHLYLMRGPIVAPQLLNQNSPATLTAVATSTITHGSGNVLLTLTGSGFIPGVAVEWNGAYRTTTIVDPTHLTVAIPAADLATAGTGSLTATNPGASASSAISITVN